MRTNKHGEAVVATQSCEMKECRELTIVRKEMYSVRDDPSCELDSISKHIRRS